MSRPTGTVTFLFTDIAGSTYLWETAREAMTTGLARHDEILRESIGRHRGQMFSTGGDGVAAVFSRAEDAVHAAVDAQQELRTQAWAAEAALWVRMGLHSGEAYERDGDYFGSVVNRAARVMTATTPGHVLITATTADIAHQADGLVFSAVGAHRLKGVATPVELVAVTPAGVEWPGRPVSEPGVRRGNLAAPLTDFVGDLLALRRRADALLSHRIVTLTGPGGVGKTRAATEIAWMLTDEFPDGTWIIELAPLTDANAVSDAVAATLGATPQPGMTVIETIVDWLRGRRALLVVDNCEHVLETTAGVARAIAAQCPTVRVLATSREPLGVDGERVVAIPSLPSHAAADLFRNRATALYDAFSPSEPDDAHIVRICERLDGIPLAIELAAARTRALSLGEIADRLDDRFKLLRGGRAAVERHQTLRATVQWSYQLLTADEQRLFCRLAVFARGFHLAAAESICADDRLSADTIIDLLTSLVDKSMVVADPTTTPRRYHLLETLRQYAEEHLSERPDEVAAIRVRHAQHYFAQARAAKSRWHSPAFLEACAFFEREWDNLRAAHQFACETGDIASANEITWDVGVYAYTRTLREHADWAARVVDAARSRGCERDALDALNVVSSWAPNEAVALQCARRTIELSRDSDAGLIAWINIANRTVILADQGAFEEAYAHAAQGPQPQDSRRALIWLYSLATLTTDAALSEFYVRRIELLARATGSPEMAISALESRGQLHTKAVPPQFDRAVALFDEASAAARSFGIDDFEYFARSRAVLAAFAANRPDAPSRALAALTLEADLRRGARLGQFFAAALAFDALGHRVGVGRSLGRLGFDRRPLPTRWAYTPVFVDRFARMRTTSADLAEEIERGRVMSPDEFLAFAISELREALNTPGPSP